MRPLIAAFLLLVTAAAAAQDPMSAATDLYAAAAFEEALVALQSVKDKHEGDVLRQADQYRAFCLLALGRTTEAESAAEAAVRRDPLATVDARDASPRVVAMFTSVRRRVLPLLILDSYRAACATSSGSARCSTRRRPSGCLTRGLQICQSSSTDSSSFIGRRWPHLHRRSNLPRRPSWPPRRQS